MAHTTTQRAQIIFATALECMFLQFTPSFLSLIGSVIILASAIYVVVSHAIHLFCVMESIIYDSMFLIHFMCSFLIQKLAKLNTPDLPADAGAATSGQIEDLEEAAGMEWGLLKGVDRNVSYTKL